MRTADAQIPAEIALEAIINPKGVSSPNSIVIPSCKIKVVASTRIKNGQTRITIIKDATAAPRLFNPETRSWIPVDATLISMIAKAGSHIQNFASG